MVSRGLWLLAIAVAAFFIGGCAEGVYVYRPAQQATARVGQLPAARYAIPSEKPTGEVLVASSGLVELPNAETRTPALFVRLIVTNNTDDAPFSVDTREQFAFVGGQKQSPAVANTYGQSQPVFEIPRGEKRVIDLFYRLPPKVEGDEQLPQFEVAWNVQTATRTVGERTSFDRISVEPVYYSGYPHYYRYGWGPYWYDPFWYGYPYYGGVYIGVRPWHYGYGGYYGGYRRPAYVRPAPVRRYARSKV
jgi:hypothetical protein